MNKLLALAGLLAALPASAQNVFVEMGDEGAGSPVVEMESPAYPRGNIRRGQEAWVRLAFVIDADGRAADPIVIDSTGGPEFEQAAREAARNWRFEVPADGMELPRNFVDLRFEMERGRDRATVNFMRRSRRIVEHLFRENTELARQMLDETVALGGWNLYETTMLTLMAGRVAGQEGDPAQQLEFYRRALGVSNRNSLAGDAREDVIRKIFEIEYARGQYGAAIATRSRLPEAAVDGSGKPLPGPADILLAAAGNGSVTAAALIYNPCDCDAGTPLWTYRPLYREFSFAAPDGNVESFEARCERGRLQGTFETDRRWQLPRDWGRCELYVFGDDSAAFELVEHGSETGESERVSSVATADDVMDRGN